jgi:hypothetical protein
MHFEIILFFFFKLQSFETVKTNSRGHLRKQTKDFILFFGEKKIVFLFWKTFRTSYSPS